jgi:catechol 2,3-dioxygenase-like lactoylglutathione lyase family enzyme
VPADGIQYVEIGCRDVDRSVDFYRNLLGFAPTPAGPPTSGGAWPGTTDRPTRWLTAGHALLSLVEVEHGDLGGWAADDLQRGVRHIGFKVGNVDLQAARLRADGVQFTVEPLDAVGDVRLAFFLDPDGALLEIIDGNLAYTSTGRRDLADRERAAALSRPHDAMPVIDHVAITVRDLDACLAFYRDRLGYPVIGTLVHENDPRGFLITYLQAGASVLEVFSFTADTFENPRVPAPSLLGLREVALAGHDLGEPGSLVTDPDGIPLRCVASWGG